MVLWVESSITSFCTPRAETGSSGLEYNTFATDFVVMKVASRSSFSSFGEINEGAKKHTKQLHHNKELHPSSKSDAFV